MSSEVQGCREACLTSEGHSQHYYCCAFPAKPCAFICIIHWHLLVPCTKYRPWYWIWISASHICRPSKYNKMKQSLLITPKLIKGEQIGKLNFMNIAWQQEGSKKAQPGLSYADISRAVGPGVWDISDCLQMSFMLRKQQVCFGPFVFVIIHCAVGSFSLTGQKHLDH